MSRKIAKEFNSIECLTKLKLKTRKEVETMKHLKTKNFEILHEVSGAVRVN